MVFNRWLLLMALELLNGAAGTMIKLNNGGFEDIVIAINPEVPEDDKIIASIKDMIGEASAYLFNASKQRFYFKAVKVVIPLTWTSKPEYKPVTTDSYEKADVIVADPFLKHGDGPYTLQYGGCGEQGRYIHFTPNFLVNDKFQVFYGTRGRVFVHEWAHLRWGVFDEYNIDAPFYTTGKNEAEPTRCSASVTGQYKLRTSSGTFRDCKFEHRTQLYEAGCLFIPDKQQNTAASIMYMQSLPSVTQFCDESNHNIYATNLQNKLCKQRSTWEVIKNSADYVGSSQISGPPPDPVISVLQTRDRVVCLVLDVSGSMGGVSLFFTSRRNAANTRTNICAGVRQGFQVFRKKYSSTEGCEIVLLTDGEDSNILSCFNEVKSSGSVIHTIALGPDAAKELEMLSDVAGGFKLYATDSLDSNGLIDAFSRISSGSGNISQQSIQLESRGESINPGQWLNGTLTIDETVGNDTFFIVSWSVSTNPPGIFLWDPQKKKYTATDFTIDTTNRQAARLQIQGTAEVKKNHTFLTATSQVLSVTVTSRAASASVPPVTAKPYQSRDTNSYPSPIVIYAEVSQGFLPVVGATVTAMIESASGKTTELELFDDGSGADIRMHDGIYSRYFTSFQENGRYNIKVRVQGKDKTARRIRRQNHAFYVPGYVEDGEIKMNPPKPEPSADDMEAHLGRFSRTASGGSFVMSGVPDVPTDVFPPCQITDLEVQLNDDDQFLLSWTAPGNDYDLGQAERYEIKMSDHPLQLRDATFPDATSVSTSGLIPAAAGVKQSFQYKLENFGKENGTSIYFAIRAIDNSSNAGEVSNIQHLSLSLSLSQLTISLNSNIQIHILHFGMTSLFSEVLFIFLVAG
uniref:VWFA domain-containing protein n=1 Tax=Varanus komodoensis TaxID=61221 RepID=A0A8D2JAD0_VARKO